MPLTASGIYLPNKIKDATALPEDVSSGKIFYNNDGKGIGTLSESIKTIINVNKNEIFDISKNKKIQVREPKLICENGGTSYFYLESWEPTH